MQGLVNAAAAADDDGDGSDDIGNLIVNSSTAPVPMRVALYVHTANVVWTLFVLLVGAIPYYHYWGAEVSLVGLMVVAPLWCFSYLIAALAHANSRIITVAVCGAFWTLCSAALVGFASAELFNIAPLQLVAISFAQSIANVIYVQLAGASPASHEGVNWRWAVPGMAAATVLVWAASIYGFVIEHDWLFAAALAALGALLAAYNARSLAQARNYAMNNADVARAICDYYMGDTAGVIKRL